VKIALIKSIRKGVFFDKKYWARNSKGGDVLKPVYFSSTIMDDKAQQVKKCPFNFCYKISKVLRAASGEISQGPECYDKRSRG
jgi:hypothetical protein